jgi:hypothetical protein
MTNSHPTPKRPALCLILLRAGFTGPNGHPLTGGLLPHHFTLTCVRAGTDHRRYLSAALSVVSTAFPRVDRLDTFQLGSALFCGVRTFLCPKAEASEAATARNPRHYDCCHFNCVATGLTTG